MPTFKRVPTVRVEQLIRAPRSAVYSAFIEPDKLTQFWLSSASGRLEPGKSIRWDFLVRGASDSVRVLALVRNQRIRVQWSNGSTTAWTFTSLGRRQTRVRVDQAGFTGHADAILAEAVDSAQGFAYVLSDLKVLLERRTQAGIVKDKAKLIEREMRAAARRR